MPAAKHRDGHSVSSLIHIRAQSEPVVAVLYSAALQGHLDQRRQGDAEFQQAAQKAGTPGPGALATEKAQQGDRTHAPERRVAKAQCAFPVVADAAKALQRLQQLRRFVTYFLTVHFHAQADQGLAQLTASIALVRFGFTHGINRSRSLASSSRVAWNGDDSSKIAALRRNPQKIAARK
ncbi:hypothetical protein ALQ49_102240 [Pseudomonas syringae pv. apii]|uniref:Uncharacterized protein n=1 Tax=Pseudomonas syringae pv. apii TaxID=81036 RepID=A0A3M3S1D7_9PSED|nr:hypothetical protein ALQ49_102240 [Pseudomonas syringae pv. apii]